MDWLRRYLGTLNWSLWIPVLLSGVVLYGSWLVRVRLIDATLPYCQHVDEHLWTERAIHILRSGDLNPHRFTKPSVMVYLTAAGVALGIIKAGMSGKPIPNPGRWTEGGYPYYTMPEAIRVPRLMLAGLSIATMCIAALVACAIYRAWLARNTETVDVRSARASTAWVAFGTILVLALSPAFLRLSWLYINVDVIGCFFSMCTIAYLSLHRRGTSPLVVSLTTGVLVGLCIGTKYNLYPIFIPAFLMVAFEYRARWLSSTLIIVLSAAVTFILTTPYALLDLPAFVWAAAKQAQHYSSGVKSIRYRPGLDMFFQYAKATFSGLSPLVSLFAGYGLYRAARLDWRKTLVITSFPFLLWLYMSRQTVFFARNLVVLQVYVAMYGALGFTWLLHSSANWTWGTNPLSKRVEGRIPKALRALPLKPLLVAATCLVVLGTTSLKGVSAAARAQAESRVEVVKWLEREVEPGTVLLVAEELEMDLRPIEKRYKVKKYKALKRELARLGRRYPGAVALTPDFKKKGRERGGLRASRGTEVARFGRSALPLRPLSVGSAHTYNAKVNPKITVFRLEKSSTTRQVNAAPL